MIDPADQDRPKWFVIRSNPRQERTALQRLCAENVEAYLPMVVQPGARGGLNGVPMFPGYLFIRLPMVSDRWRKVFTAQGVNCLIGAGRRLSPLADRVIAEVKAREHDGFVSMSLEAEPVHSFRKGELVMIKKGPFATLEAVFHEPVGRRRCVILIQLLGQTPRLAEADVHNLDHKAA